MDQHHIHLMISAGIGDVLMLHQSQTSQFHIGLRVTRKGPETDTPPNPTGFGSILVPQPTGAQSARADVSTRSRADICLTHTRLAAAGLVTRQYSQDAWQCHTQ